MIVDSTHKPWIYGSLAGAAALALAYAALRAVWLGRWGGGTPFGLFCGFVAAAILVFDGLLGIRKKFPTLRVGRTHQWLKAHVWLGLLGFVAVLLHSGLSLGGPLTSALMFLFALVTLSGVAGMVLQQFVPRIMMAELPQEAIFEQLTEALENVRETADQIVKKLGAAPSDNPAATPDTRSDAQRVLGELYVNRLRPFLRGEGGGLAGSARNTRLMFEHLRKLFPPENHDQLGELEKLTTRRRELSVQKKLHYILHGWLLVHVPLSAALFVLMLVHACVALLYT